jgi:uracil-DNA glycosylase
MIIGDAPGIGKSPANYDRTMTWGPTSHMLRKALLSQNLYYISWFTNLVKVSQLNNAPTTRGDVEAWKPFLLREIVELSPKVFILLGNHVFEMFKNVYPVQYALGLPETRAAGSITRWIKVPHPSWINRKNIGFSEYGDIIKAELVKIDEFY